MIQKSLIVAAVLAVMCATPATWGAEAPGSTEDHKIFELSRSELPGDPTKEAILLVMEFAPGVQVPKHYHNAQSLGLVLEGSLYTQWEDSKGRVVYGPGEYWSEANKTVHSAGNVSSTKPVRFIVLRIVPKGQPMNVPVK